MAHLAEANLSKPDRVSRAILSRIRRGGLAPGAKLPSEPELASHYGVSRVTVRRAIRTLVQRGVLESQRGIGHVVRSHEPSLTVGLMLGTAQFTPFQRQMLRAFETALRERGYDAHVYILRVAEQETPADGRPVMDDVRAGRLTGLLTVSWSELDNEHAAHLKSVLDEQGVPCVSITNRDVRGAIGVDEHSLGYDSAHHLLSRGYRRIAVVLPPGEPDSVEAGWRAAYHDWGLTPPDELRLRWPSRDEASGYQAFGAWWAQSPDADALLVPDDHTAKGVISAATQMGLDLHRRLRVASLWIQGSDLFVPGPFVRIELSPKVMADRALHVLEQMIGGEPAPPPMHVAAGIVDDLQANHDGAQP